MTLAPEVAAVPAASVTPTPDLLTAPLPQLLAAHDVELVDSSITDADFFGAFVERRDGTRVLSMPVGRSDFERDTTARMLLTDGLGLDAPALPSALEFTRA